MACLKISIELNRGFKPLDVFNRDVQSLNPPNLNFFSYYLILRRN